MKVSSHSQAGFLIGLAIFVGPGLPGTALADEHALASLDLVDLVKLEVTTVSRKTQKLSDTPAVVSILSAEDIRRSGARNLPVLLRLLPGVQVAQIGANRWAVGVRGFNSRFSNKFPSEPATIPRSAFLKGVWRF